MHKAWLAFSLLLSGEVVAQAAPSEEPAQEKDATTLPTLKVTAPRPATLPEFDNPIKADPTRFDRDYQEPLSAEKIAQNGGIVPLLVGYAAKGITAGARKLPGWKEPEQNAIARPPPLSEEQMARAARLSQSAGGN